MTNQTTQGVVATTLVAISYAVVSGAASWSAIRTSGIASLGGTCRACMQLLSSHERNGCEP
jgi:hypothetical protein